MPASGSIAGTKRVPDHAPWKVVINRIVILEDIKLGVAEPGDMPVAKTEEAAVAMPGGKAIVVAPKARQALGVPGIALGNFARRDSALGEEHYRAAGAQLTELGDRLRAVQMGVEHVVEERRPQLIADAV